MSEHKTFSVEEVRMLAKVEQDMDSGAQPFVMNKGQRWAVMPSVAEELGIKSGQTASDMLIVAILKASIAHCEAQVALQKAAAT